MGIRDDEDEEETTEEAPEEEVSEEDEDETSKDQDEEPDDEEAATPEQAAASVNEAPLSAAPVASDSPEERTKVLQDYLMAKYGEAADASGIKAARESANNRNVIANIGHAFETLGRANAQAHGSHVGVDDNFYNGLKAEGQQGIQQAMMDRQSKVNQFLQENALKQQVAQNMLSRGTAEQKIQAQKWMQDFNEKKLELSKEENALKYKTSAENTALKVQQLADAAKGRAFLASEGQKNRQATLDSTQSVKQDAVRRAAAVKDLKDLGKDYDAQTASSRSGLGMAANKVNGAAKVMSFADVTPDDLEAAKSDPAVKDTLVKKFNQLTPEQYTEIVSGLMTQVAPGAGSFGQLEHMRAETMSQGAAKLKQYFTSNPAPAGMGQMIFNNMMTLKNERDTSQKVIDDHDAKMAKKHPFAFSEKDPEIQGYAQDMRDAFMSKLTQPEASPANVSAPSGGPAPSTKNLGGVTYYKVPGGWSKTPVTQTAGQ